MKKILTIILILISLSINAQTPYSNPANIYGSDFMSYMQILRKMGDYDTMIKFTYSKSIKKLGSKRIITYYKDKFTNVSKLRLFSVTKNTNGTRTMNYTNLNLATKSTISVDIIIENDSCKLIIPNNLQQKLLN